MGTNTTESGPRKPYPINVDTLTLIPPIAGMLCASPRGTAASYPARNNRLSPRHSSLLPCTQQSPHSTTRHHLSLRPVWFGKSVSSRSDDEGNAWQEGRRGEVGWSRLGSRGDIRAEHSRRAPSPSRATAKTVRNGDGDPSQAGPEKGCPWDPLPIVAQTRSWEVHESTVSYLSHHTAAFGRIFLFRTLTRYLPVTLVLRGLVSPNN